MKQEKWLVFSVILLAISIAGSAYFIGNSILASKKSSTEITIEQKANEDILSFSDAAVYLKVPEPKLKSLVENSKLMDGVGIPYYKIDTTILFSKTALTKWIIYLSENKFEY